MSRPDRDADLLPAPPARLFVVALLAAPSIVAALGPIDARAQSTGQSTAVSSAVSSPDRSIEQQLLAVDDEYVAAEVARDEASIRRLIDERFVHDLADGSTWGREAFVRHVLALPLVGQSVRERSVSVEGGVGFVFATTDLRFAAAASPRPPHRCATRAPTSGATASGACGSCRCSSA